MTGDQHKYPVPIRIRCSKVLASKHYFDKTSLTAQILDYKESRINKPYSNSVSRADMEKSISSLIGEVPVVVSSVHSLPILLVVSSIIVSYSMKN